MRVPPPDHRTRPAQTTLSDLLVFACLVAFLYGMVALARRWLAPFASGPAISLSPALLPQYAADSLLRMALAYVLSLLVFQLGSRLA